jgi:hypothetical protein
VALPYVLKSAETSHPFRGDRCAVAIVVLVCWCMTFWLPSGKLTGIAIETMAI